MDYNNFVYFKHAFLNFCQSVSHTNLLILPIPHNLTLSPWSIVNLEIRKANDFLKRTANMFSNVQFVQPWVKPDMIQRHIRKHPRYSKEGCQTITSAILGHINDACPVSVPIPLQYAGEGLVINSPEGIEDNSSEQA